MPPIFDRKDGWRPETPRPDAPFVNHLYLLHAKRNNSDYASSNKFRFETVSQTMITHYAKVGTNFDLHGVSNKCFVLQYQSGHCLNGSEFARYRQNNYNLLANVVPVESFFSSVFLSVQEN